MIKALRITGFGLLVTILVGIATPQFLLGADRQEGRFGKEPSVAQIRPPKPAKIKLHRNNKGEYSWDITGDNVDDIVKADRKLRKLLRIE